MGCNRTERLCPQNSPPAHVWKPSTFTEQLPGARPWISNLSLSEDPSYLHLHKFKSFPASKHNSHLQTLTHSASSLVTFFFLPLHKRHFLKGSAAHTYCQLSLTSHLFLSPTAICPLPLLNLLCKVTYQRPPEFPGCFPAFGLSGIHTVDPAFFQKYVSPWLQ